MGPRVRSRVFLAWSCLALAGCAQPLTTHIPDIDFQLQERTDRLVVLAADAGAAWEHFEVQAAGTRHALNAGPYQTGTIGQGRIHAGDTLHFCGPPDGAQVRIVHAPTGQIVHATEFFTLRSC